jgi:hypothetical protein
MKKSKLKMKKPTEAEIKAEIALLEEMKPHVRATSYFGDNHHASIDLQLRVLDGELDEDDLFDATEGNWDRESIGRDALKWMNGEQDEEDGPPSKGWMELIVDGWKPKKKGGKR